MLPSAPSKADYRMLLAYVLENYSVLRAAFGRCHAVFSGVFVEHWVQRNVAEDREVRIGSFMTTQ